MREAFAFIIAVRPRASNNSFFFLITCVTVIITMILPQHKDLVNISFSDYFSLVLL